MLALMMCLAWTSPAKAAIKAQITLAAPDRAVVGETFDVTIKVGVSDFTAKTVHFEIVYDKTRLEPVFTDDDKLGTPLYQPDHDGVDWDLDKNLCMVIWVADAYGETAIGSEDGVVEFFKMSFKVKDSAPDGLATINVDFSNGSIADARSNDPTEMDNAVELRDSEISITAANVNVTHLESSDATLSKLTPSVGELSPTFAPDVTDYTMTVPYTTEKVSFTAVANHSAATFTGAGEYALAAGAVTEVKIIVTAQDNSTKEYKINVTRTAAATDNTLSSLKVAGQDIFEPAKDVYELTVPYETTKVMLEALANNEFATLVGTGEKTLGEGGETSSFDIVVTAQNGDTKTYTVKIKRTACADNKLKGLTVSAGTLSPAFSADVLEYTLALEYKTKQFNVAAVANHATAKVEVSSTAFTESKDVVTLVVTVTVTAQDGTTRVYTINVTRAAASTDNTLKSLTVSGGTLSPEFSSAVNQYTMTVENSVASILLNAVANDAKATLKSVGFTNNKDIALKVGENKFEITVTSESGVANTYKVTVTRKPSENNLLLALKPSAGKLSPTFDANVTNYTMSVDFAVKTVTFTPTVADKTATVKVEGGTNLAVGANTVTVTVTAQSGAIKTYVVVITKNPADTNSDLKSLTVSSGTLNPGFAVGTKQYVVKVPYSISKITIKGTASSGVATVSGNVTNAALAVGDNTFTITVTAQDKTHKSVYTVTVQREKPSTDNSLESLTPSVGQFDKEFTPDEGMYSMTVPYSADKVVFTFQKGNQLATVNVASPYTVELEAGKTTAVKITVKAQSGDTRVYTVNVTRTAAATDSTLKSLEPSSGLFNQIFAPDVTEYTMRVGFATEVMDLIYELNNEFATAQLEGERQLELGENVFTLTVTAEDGSKTVYTVTVERTLLSSDTTLKALTVSGAKLDFDPKTREYQVQVPVGMLVADIHFEVTDEKSTALLAGGETLDPAGENVYTVTVTAEDGSVGEYVIEISFRDVETDSSLSDIWDDLGAIEFEEGKTEYDVTVSHNANSINIEYTVSGEYAVALAEFPRTLESVGKTVFTITVLAEDGSQTVYTINVTKGDIPDNTKLDALVASYGTLAPDFDPNVTDYTLVVPFSVERIEFVYMLRDNTSTVEIAGEDLLVAGQENLYEIKVTATDGEYTIYRVAVTRNLISSDATLSEININGEPLKGFDPAVNEYFITIPNSVKEMLVEAVANYMAAKVDITEPEQLAVGENVYVITVTAEDGTVAEYKITVTRLEVDSDATLKELYTDKGEIEFDPNVTEYEIKLENDVTSIAITYEVSSPYARAELLGNSVLVEGDNIYTITVTADDGTVKVYTITVNRRPLSTDSSAKEIIVGGIRLDLLQVDKTYVVELPYTTTQLEIIASANDAKATVDVVANEDLQVGNNTATVTITAENGSKTSYYITVVRDAGSSNASLVQLRPLVGAFKEEFVSNKYTYNMKVKNEVELLEFEVVTSDALSTYTIMGNQLVEGENKVEILVVSQNGTKLTYVVNVIREGDSLWYKLTHTVLFSIGSFGVTVLVFGLAAIVIIAACVVILLLIINKNKVKRIR